MNRETEQGSLPERKTMRAKYYGYSSTGAYFLTICTQDRKMILSKIAKTETAKSVGDDAHGVPQARLTKIGKIVEKYILSTNNVKGVSVGDFVIMPNHIHLILFIDEDGTPRASSPTRQTSIVSNCVSTLKRFVNKEIGENIFQRSFYDRIIRNRDEYMEICNYIRLNPDNWENDELYS